MVLLSTILGGCALPGYDSGSITANHWYDFGSSKESTYEQKLSNETQVDYKPSVVKITPSLIAYQSSQPENVLDPDVLALTHKSNEVGNYVIGKGDVLQVIVFGHPELTNPGGDSGGNDSTRGQLVDANGKIYYPYVGEVDAAGKTLSDLRQILTHRLADYIRDPQIDVRVSQYRSQKIYVSGDISRPCTIPITDLNINIIEALDGCDSLGTKTGGGVAVQNVRLIRGDSSTLVNLSKLYATGKQIDLQPNDRLLIDDTANRVFMVGEFGKQTALPYATGGLSLNDAIADAGGLDPGTADTSNVYVIRGFIDGKDFQTGGIKTVMHPKVYKLNASNPAGLLLANQFELQPRDVVFAAPASFVNFNRALSLILPSVSLLTRGFYLGDRIGG